ncbi:MAG: Gfo/Idh/MocA family oxidoreductase [Kiritimatiellae bacterium]|nr:Gfo/Idh/MocA family oxidoreductase [Kiritimatiellia bacterium]MDD5521375.1 Gfo/Idh/MocA family oxidoreductase [Kiritimatiellia bacterium]
MKHWYFFLVLVFATAVITADNLSAASDAKSGSELRIGIIGLDTSHVVAFTDVLNNPSNKNHVAGGRIVAAFKGGSKDIPSSWDRVEGYTKTLQEKYNVKIVDSIEELCKQVDAVMLESVDGRPHLEQARPVIKAGKPMFIDKPMAGSLRDVLEIFKLARENKVPVFSASSLRYGKDAQAVRKGSIGKVLSAEVSSPCSLEPHHPDLFWYGIHGVESLFTVMGTGCEAVKRGTTADGKIEVTGTWRGGRTGIYRESSHGKGSKPYTGIAKGEKGESPVGGYDGYAPLVVEAVKFFQTGVSPIPVDETIEIFAFMEAADESKRQNGQPVSIYDVLKKSGYDRK